MRIQHFQPGDWVVYRKTKFSAQPGPRAENVAPAQHGDNYSYTVDKFWIVQEVRDDGTLVLRTRRGKRYTVNARDIQLRKANIWERWRYRSRFQETTLNPPHDRSTVDDSMYRVAQ